MAILSHTTKHLLWLAVGLLSCATAWPASAQTCPDGVRQSAICGELRAVSPQRTDIVLGFQFAQSPHDRGVQFSQILSTMVAQDVTTALGFSPLSTGGGTLSAGGNWSSFNIGKQLFLTTPSGASNPALGISDSSGTNNWAIVNNAGTLQFLRMPALTDSTSAPSLVVTMAATGISANQPYSVPGLTLTSGGHAISTGTVPTLSSCGTGPTTSAAATDVKGTITEGTTATGCIVTFHTAYATAPDCVLSSWSGNTNLVSISAVSTTALTVANSSATGDKFSYHCIQ